MAQLVVMYKAPQDTAAFDKHYFEKHVALAKRILGMKKYEISRDSIETPSGPSGYHLVLAIKNG